MGDEKLATRSGLHTIRCGGHTISSTEGYLETIRKEKARQKSAESEMDEAIWHNEQMERIVENGL
jgi:hypothetical protein